MRAIKCIRQGRLSLVDPSSLVSTASRGDEIRSSGRSGLEQRGASIDTKRPRARRRFHGLQRVARSVESENRKPMNQDSALLNYLSSNAPSLGIYIHNRSGPPNEGFGRPYSGPRRVL